MGYPETFDGYMISSHESWSGSQKQEVGSPFEPIRKSYEKVLISYLCSPNQSRSVSAMLKLRSKHVVYAEVISTPSLVAGGKPSSLSM